MKANGSQIFTSLKRKKRKSPKERTFFLSFTLLIFCPAADAQGVTKYPLSRKSLLQNSKQYCNSVVGAMGECASECAVDDCACKSANFSSRTDFFFSPRAVLVVELCPAPPSPAPSLPAPPLPYSASVCAWTSRASRVLSLTGIFRRSSCRPATAGIAGIAVVNAIRSCNLDNV